MATTTDIKIIHTAVSSIQSQRKWTMTRFILTLIVFSCVSCGGHLSGVRKLAAMDLHCNVQEMTLDKLGPNQVIVTGCGQTQIYTRKCARCPWEQDTAHTTTVGSR